MLFYQRLSTTYARCRSLSAEGLEKNNFRELFYSHQAAKVAKEKHGYFCSGFPRLFTTYACYRSLSAEGLEKNNFREIFYSRQAAKVAKEKHGYFCSGFSRLFTTYARCRSLSAEDRASVEAASEAECILDA